VKASTGKPRRSFLLGRLRGSLARFLDGLDSAEINSF
jgi:hypothetical protein